MIFLPAFTATGTAYVKHSLDNVNATMASKGPTVAWTVVVKDTGFVTKVRDTYDLRIAI